MSTGKESLLESRPLRDALVAAVNGNPVTADEAWALIHRWDDLAGHFTGCPIAQQEADPNWGHVS